MNQSITTPVLHEDLAEPQNVRFLTQNKDTQQNINFT